LILGNSRDRGHRSLPVLKLIPVLYFFFIPGSSARRLPRW
jgi:hypothetical protein